MVRPRQITDEQILDVARQMFYEHGPSVSTNAIAKELEISQASLFKRFGTKAALLRRAMKIPSHPPWTTLLEPGPDPAEPLREQMLHIATAINAFFEELAPAAVVMKMSGCSPSDLFNDGEVPAPVRGIRALTAWFERAEANGQIRPGTAGEVAMSLIGALHTRPFMKHMFGARDLVDGDAFVRFVVDTHWNAIAPEP